jgi:hypothetical protein
LFVSSQADAEGYAQLDLQGFADNEEPLKLYVHGIDLKMSQIEVGISQGLGE